jgi:signal transduction histidine kinase
MRSDIEVRAPAPDDSFQAPGPKSPAPQVGRKALPGYRLHVILFAALVLISTVPIVLLGGWVEHSAMEKEIASVSEKHLIIARNLSRTLNRYSEDIKEGFRAAIDIGAQSEVPSSISRLLLSLSFNHVCIVDKDNNLIRSLIPETTDVKPLLPDSELFAPLRQLAQSANGDVAMTDLILDRGISRFFLVQALEDGRIAIGALSVDYIRSVQQAIAFGKRGHSMVVDAKGHVVAHPDGEWERTAKDASGLSVVASMMRGDTGVARFYSPPMEADMIAGYTNVPATGWGVMVPQPMSELRDRASDTQIIAMLLSGAGILIAAGISWWLAKFLARPIVAIEKAAGVVAAGNLDIRVENLPKHAPRELHRLADNFDSMIGNLRQREERLRIAMREAEAANRAKTEFLANMSHELRTPLNGILGFADILRYEMFGPVGAPRYIDYAKEIHKAGSHLLDVINDILDMAKVEANELSLMKSKVDLKEIVQSCLRLTEARATQDRIVLRADIAADLPAVNCDRRMTTQIMLNLMSTAIKFTPESGTVTVHVALDGDGGCVIQVIDTGIGIPADHLELIMKPFYQVETTLQHKYEGTGLGLPLVKAMADIQGATLRIDSIEGKGTTATVRFPPDAVLAKEQTDTAEAVSATPRRAPVPMVSC